MVIVTHMLVKEGQSNDGNQSQYLPELQNALAIYGDLVPKKNINDWFRYQSEGFRTITEGENFVSFTLQKGVLVRNDTLRITPDKIYTPKIKTLIPAGHDEDSLLVSQITAVKKNTSKGPITEINISKSLNLIGPLENVTGSYGLILTARLCSWDASGNNGKSSITLNTPDAEKFVPDGAWGDCCRELVLDPADTADLDFFNSRISWLGFAPQQKGDSLRQIYYNLQSQTKTMMGAGHNLAIHTADPRINLW